MKSTSNIKDGMHRSHLPIPRPAAPGNLSRVFGMSSSLPLALPLEAVAW